MEKVNEKIEMLEKRMTRMEVESDRQKDITNELKVKMLLLKNEYDHMRFDHMRNQ